MILGEEVEVAVPGLGENVDVAVLVDVGADRFVGGSAGCDDMLSPLLAKAVCVFPDEPAVLAFSERAAAGEDVGVAVGVEIGDADGVEVLVVTGEANEDTRPSAASSVIVSEPGDPSAEDVAFCLDEVEISVGVEVEEFRSGLQAPGADLAEVEVRVLDPGRSLPVRILKPAVEARQVHIAITVDVAGSESAVAGRIGGAKDLVLDPGLGRVRRNGVPEDALLIEEGEEVEFAVAVEVGGEIVVGGDGAGFEALKRLPGVTGVAIPGGAGDLVNPAVAVHVEGRTADVGGSFLADQMAAPVVRGAVLEPIDRASAGAGDEVDVAVFIDVDRGGLAKLVAAGAVDLMDDKGEWGRGRGLGRCAAGRGESGQDADGERPHSSD